jgi:hypothetical protein
MAWKSKYDLALTDIKSLALQRHLSDKMFSNNIIVRLLSFIYRSCRYGNGTSLMGRKKFFLDVFHDSQASQVLKAEFYARKPSRE